MKRETYLKRFFSKILTTRGGCWEWQGFRNSQGYGAGKHLRQTLAHRISFELFRGPLLAEMCVLHKCDNPCCVNPNHLFIGDRDINNKDRAKKGRTISHNKGKKYCMYGHEFTLENTAVRSHGRKCRKCEAARSIRVYWEKHPVRKRAKNGSSHCIRGHEFTEENTYWSGNCRQCKSCNRMRQIRRKERLKCQTSSLL